MKKSNLVLHEGTVKHRKASESVLKSDSGIMKIFCTKPTAQRDQVKIFEVKYAVGIACHSSISSVDHFTEIVSELSKGQALENVKLHRTKCSAILKNIVSISVLEELISELKSSKYSLLIDESTDIAGSKHLTFVLPIIQDFESVNASFQATDAEPSKVFSELKQLHTYFASRLYQNPSESTVTLPLDRVRFGAKFEFKLSKSQLSEQEKSNIKKRCHGFLLEAKSQLDKRLSQDMDILENLKYFQPKECLSQIRKPFQRIAASFTHLVDNPSVGKETDLKLELQYDEILLVQWKKEFDGDEIPNDSVTFWVAVKQYENAAGVKCFSELAEMVLNAHVIPLSNAYVERIFSHVTNIKSKVRNRLTLETMEAVLRIRSKLAEEKICCNKFKVTDKMLRYVRLEMSR
ncbi:hypothetical protein Pmani_008484 [Petrolisthes manimaculis]|uniref:HAT C-terminal dimerisation domain-containing protein n=1 Tax=Petrolisthes manimaculis TaxID=1843537 RepID=A0AAE1Q6Q5_9EUCA|nr:hypothetical protein Pmani_008484 [Petrolisthes manimaculis]